MINWDILFTFFFNFFWSHTCMDVYLTITLLYYIRSYKRYACFWILCYIVLWKKNVICNSSIKICLNQQKSWVTKSIRDEWRPSKRETNRGWRWAKSIETNRSHEMVRMDSIRAESTISYDWWMESIEARSAVSHRGWIFRFIHHYRIIFRLFYS